MRAYPVIIKFTYEEYHHRCSSQVEANSANIRKKKHTAFLIVLESSYSPVALLYSLGAVYCHSINSMYLEYLEVKKG